MDDYLDPALQADASSSNGPSQYEEFQCAAEDPDAAQEQEGYNCYGHAGHMSGPSAENVSHVGYLATNGNEESNGNYYGGAIDPAIGYPYSTEANPSTNGAAYYNVAAQHPSYPAYNSGHYEPYLDSQPPGSPAPPDGYFPLEQYQAAYDQGYGEPDAGPSQAPPTLAGAPPLSDPTETPSSVPLAGDDVSSSVPEGRLRGPPRGPRGPYKKTRERLSNQPPTPSVGPSQDQEEQPVHEEERISVTPRLVVNRTIGEALPAIIAKKHGSNLLETPKVMRDPDCSFCGGTDTRNKDGNKEFMLSCRKCGRSGHPSCLSMESPSLRKKVRTYQWECIECKVCEICLDKGDDNRLMFCDGCDRGWHYYCLTPPLAKAPKGLWKCPLCVEGGESAREGTSAPGHHGHMYTDSPTRGTVSHKRKLGKERAIDSEAEAGKHKNNSCLFDSPVGVKHKKTAGSETPHQQTILRLKMPSTEPSKKKRKAEEIVQHEEEPETEEPEEQKDPFGGILNDEEGSTLATRISDADRRAFENSRKVADAKLGALNHVREPFRERSATPSTEASGSTSKTQPQTPIRSFTQGRLLRDRLLASIPHSVASPLRPPPTETDSLTSIPQAFVSEKIKTIRFGEYDIDTWYSAPYPEEYARVPDGRLWLCEFCLKYMKSGFVAERHALKCQTRHPPGDEIYRDGNISIFEVDGRKNKIYCQNLCLIAKMFLDHKTLYYDVEPFLFYVMTEVNENGARFVGYFSKEKRTPQNNVSCIMTLPVRQRKGWGNLLIDFSYLLSKKEGRAGSPEKPLSALGALSYRNYWKSSVFTLLSKTQSGDLRLEDISKATSMTLTDVLSTLKEHHLIEIYRTETKHAHSAPLGGFARQALSRHHAPVNDSTTLPTDYRIHWDPQVINEYCAKTKAKGHLELKPEKLKYTPFLVTRIELQEDGMLVTEPEPVTSNGEIELREKSPVQKHRVPKFADGIDEDYEEAEADDDEEAQKTDEDDDADFVEEATPPPVPRAAESPHSTRLRSVDTASPSRRSTRNEVTAAMKESPTKSLRMTRTISRLLD